MPQGRLPAKDSDGGGTIQQIVVLYSVTTYYPNDFKTYLVVKPEFEKVAKDAFAGTDVHITTPGKRQLGAAIGSKTFAEEYVSNKVEGRTKDIKNLAQIALSQPHAAKKAFQKMRSV